jgi:hypothetical protein
VVVTWGFEILVVLARGEKKTEKLIKPRKPEKK